VEPLIGTLDFDSGKTDGLKREQKTLRELSGLFADEAAFALELAKDPSRLVYEVFTLQPDENAAHLACHVTIIQPGTVGKEFFFTKGHLHQIQETAEIYLCIKGTGLLLLQRESDVRTVKMQPGTIVYIPPRWAHRTINIGDTPLVFFSVHRADAGYDYRASTQFLKRILKKHNNEGYEIHNSF